MTILQLSDDTLTDLKLCKPSEYDACKFYDKHQSYIAVAVAYFEKYGVQAIPIHSKEEIDEEKIDGMIEEMKHLRLLHGQFTAEEMFTIIKSAIKEAYANMID